MLKRLRSKISALVCNVLLITCILISIIGCIGNMQTASDVLMQNLEITASVAADKISTTILAYQNIAREVGFLTRLANPENEAEKKLEIINQRCEIYGFQRGNIILADGKSIFDGNDYSDREYFKESMKGNLWISEPIISKITNEPVVIISAPLWKDGAHGTEVIGVVYFVPDSEVLNNIVREIHVGKNGFAYIINKDETNIADSDSSKVGAANNASLAKTDSSYASWATAEKNMLTGGSGVSEYTFKDNDMLLGYAPIPNSNGWSIGVAVQTSDFFAKMLESINLIVIVSILVLIVAVTISFIMVNRIASPIVLVSNRMKLLADGDTHSSFSITKRNDETGTLMLATQSMLEKLTALINELSSIYTEISHGNLCVKMEKDYEGDFAVLSESTRQIIESLNDTMRQIGESADTVAQGAYQVNAGSQALAQGSTEQASSVEELSASITDIAGKVSSSSINADKASQMSAATEKLVNDGNQKMITMTEAMNNISETSSQIEKIIKSIEDIALQTNILALNAAVEASRAGAAGRGFAVVADEVRVLAQKSSEAAKNTTDLIKNSLRAVRNGNTIAEETASMLNEIVTDVSDVNRLVNKIAVDSKEQSSAVQQIKIGVQQISDVVQTNSATAEESAASSETLSEEARKLKTLLAGFKYRKSI